jgi:hypothetical protein
MSVISELANWANFTTLIALVGLLLSLFNTIQNFKRERKQEERRQPRFVLSFVSGYFQNYILEEGRVYALQLKIKNLSDTNNSVADTELAIYFKRVGQPLERVLFAANNPKAQKFASSECAPMVLPISIGGHSTVSGWFYFFIPDHISERAFIDGHEVVLEDTHGNVSKLPVGLIVENSGDVAI